VHVTAGSLSTIRTEGRLGGPIVRDRLLGSVAFLRAVRNGFVRDLEHADRPLGGVDTTAVIGKLHAILNRRSNLLLTADFAHKDPTPLTYAKVLAVKPGFTVDNPPDLHDVRASAIAANRTLQYGAAARATVQLPGGATLTSLTAFRKLDFDNRNDADITELELAAGHVREIQHQWSEELTVSQQGARVTWIAGAFFFDEVDRQPVSVALGGPRLESRLDPAVEADSAAVFGQTSVRIVPRASVTAGLRYSRERKSIDNAGWLAALDPPFTILPSSVYAYTDAISHSAWTPKVAFEVDIHPGTLAYVSAARGFKSGGFNLTSQVAGRGYAPEWAWSYEGGLKTTFAGSGTSLAASVFQTDYTDLQVQTALFPGVIDISNAAAATIRGLELEATTRLAGGLRTGGHVSWLDATYDRYLAVGVSGVADATREVAGNRLNNAPEWSGRLWLEWSRGAGPAGVLSLRADTRWQSTVFFTPFNDSVQRQQAYGVLDAHAEVGPGNKRWSLGLWARNLTNVDYITGSFNSPPPAIGGRPAESRQAGIQLTLSR
jgi:iron complex outermembrane receptor protein